MKYNKMKQYARTGAFITAGFLSGYLIRGMQDAPETSAQIKAEGFPKGYHIENVQIPTRGDIIRVEKLPGEDYQKTVDAKTGMITLKGNFEYEIKPMLSAMPTDDMHTDAMGNSPYEKNTNYWTAVREGKVTLHLDKDTLEGKLKK